MLSSTSEADDVADWLRRTYPHELGAPHVLVIHTNAAGEVNKADIEKARALARTVDEETNDIRAIVSVLMLREGWDVQNVTVVVGLRPFTARANILPEQAIGRGLRLMFRGQPAAGYQERVDIIGNDKFLELVDDLEELEGIRFDAFEADKDRVQIDTVGPTPDRAEFDIAIPVLSFALVRKKGLSEAIAALDVRRLDLPPGFSIRIESDDPATFTYEGFDAATDREEIERRYAVPRARTAQEVIGYYARRIGDDLKLPSQFATLAPKVREFFEHRFFGEPVDLDNPRVVRFMASAAARHLTVGAFARAFRAVAAASAEPRVVAQARRLSECPPFPWSQWLVDTGRTVFNLVACDNEYERTFARFLESAEGVKAFAKLPLRFGFAVEYLDEKGSLRLYYPDWVVGPLTVGRTSWRQRGKSPPTSPRRIARRGCGARTRRPSQVKNGATCASSRVNSSASRQRSSPTSPPSAGRYTGSHESGARTGRPVPRRSSASLAWHASRNRSRFRGRGRFRA